MIDDSYEHILKYNKLILIQIVNIKTAWELTFQTVFLTFHNFYVSILKGIVLLIETKVKHLFSLLETKIAHRETTSALPLDHH